MVHSFSRGETMYIARDFLTVELALYSPKEQADKAPLEINYGDFQLTVNGKKIALTPMNPYAVANRARSSGLAARAARHRRHRGHARRARNARRAPAHAASRRRSAGLSAHGPAPASRSARRH